MIRVIILGFLLALAPLTGWSADEDLDSQTQEMIEKLGLWSSDTPSRDLPGWKPLKKVVVADRRDGRVEAWRSAAPGVEFVAVSSLDEAVDSVKGAQAVIGYCDQALFDAEPDIHWVQVFSSGVDRCVKHAGIHEPNRVLTNGQKLSSPALAEHSIGLMMALVRGIDAFHTNQLKQDWNWNPGLESSEFIELDGRTVLIVGLGGIGTQAARRAHGLGMRVIATRGSRREGPEYVDYVGLADEVITLAAQADVVINTAPLTDATRGMFNAEFFKAMKPTAYFVSVGRGASTVTDDLVAALNNGDIAGAGLDVTDPEPLPEGHPLWTAPRVIITPHTGGRSDRGGDRRLLLVRENLLRYMAGEPLLSQVDVSRGY